MTGEQVFVLSMALIDEMNSNGTIDGNKTKDYRGKAPSLLTILQSEIMNLENPLITNTQVTNLTLPLVMSDKAASMVAPYGLAMHFMLSEMNQELFNYFSNRYEQLKRNIIKKATIEPIEDVY